MTLQEKIRQQKGGFWNSDTINEIVYLDSLVYIKIGLGQLDDAADAAKGLEELIKTKVPDDQKSFLTFKRVYLSLSAIVYAAAVRRSGR